MPDMSITRTPADTALAAEVDRLEPDLRELRRDLHAHPELAWTESRTTELVAERLVAEGIKVQRLSRSGLIAELGSEGPVVALRADLDALPVDDTTPDPWASTVDGVAHACGHDVHTTALLGAGLALQQVLESHEVPGRVRLLFQPAEEVMPGGALEVIAAGGLAEVEHAFGLHCDPSLDVGQVGLRVGAITGAADSVRVRLTGRGGHTSRPHLTQDLTYALGTMITEIPAALSRRLDPRSGVSMVWGVVRAGAAQNVIPSYGEAAGTVRMLDPVAWAGAEELVTTLVHQVVAPFGVTAEVDYTRGVPPVVNQPRSTALLADAVELTLGEAGVVSTTQSLGGEDFGWYLEKVPGAMGRLGTRTPGGPTYDLHQGDLRIDERSTAVGAKVLGHAALTALEWTTKR
ncbi:amidohydrolase [Marmoricola bigeumensis]|uniref:Amidohydrolase n=2 Tax=Nocardioides marmoribigeumensis TaxID=433649 RepID=A0ABU2BZX6_9ACTN|nr:amidohydrolase [Nocardioides marmoribigeumensis]